MAETKSKFNFVGGLWKQESVNGKKYLQGNIEIDGVKHRISVWKNNFKEEGDKKPDYQISLMDDPAEKSSTSAKSAAPAKKAQRPAPVVEANENDDDIPF